MSGMRGMSGNNIYKYIYYQLINTYVLKLELNKRKSAIFTVIFHKWKQGNIKLSLTCQFKYDRRFKSQEQFVFITVQISHFQI